MDYRLAHVSDLHLPLSGRIRPRRQLAGKRLLALLSWQRKRRHLHTARPLAALLADLAAQGHDHLAITGDLTNLGLPSEFRSARSWLNRLGPPDSISVVPGNHDQTVAVPWPLGLGQWAPWMTADDDSGAFPGEPFPFLRRRGPLAIIGLSSALPTRPFSAAGELGVRQIGRTAALLKQARREGLFRLVLIHHPPVPGPGDSPRKALRDRTALTDVLRNNGAELVLHGHHHVSRLVTAPGPEGPILVLGVPPGSAGRARPELAGWHLHHIAREGSGWRLTTQARGYDPISDRFRQTGEWSLRIGKAQ